MKNRPLTDAEHERLVAIGDLFWESLGRMAAVHIALMPPELREHTAAYLQDKCSIYGTDYVTHVKDIW